MPAPAPSPAKDDEHALRLIGANDWLEAEGRLNSGAFYRRRTACSVFLRERLPDGDAEALHVGQFSSYGRVSVQVSHLRGFTRNGAVVGVDIVMTGTAAPPLEAFGYAHGELRLQKKDAQAFAAFVNQRGQLEKRPHALP